VTPEKHGTAQHRGSSAAQQAGSSAPHQAKSPVNAAISGFAFAPKHLKVSVGQEITWTNQDSAPHTVTASSGAKFDSGTLEQGATYTWKATKPGTVDYFCAIHPTMTGTIVVQ
jgi:plastocyanin